MLYDDPAMPGVRLEPRATTRFANSGLQPTNSKRVTARQFPPASPLGAD